MPAEFWASIATASVLVIILGALMWRCKAERKLVDSSVFGEFRFQTESNSAARASPNSSVAICSSSGQSS